MLRLRQLRSLLQLPLPLPELAVGGQQAAGYSSRKAPSEEPVHQAQPLSQAINQLEAVVTHPGLPKDTLAANRAALGTLRSFLESLRGLRTYPKAGIKNVQFSVPGPGGRLQRVRCQLKTTGGDCSRLVANSLGQMLAQVGVNPYIYYDNDEFQPNAEKEPTPEEVAGVRAKAAQAGFPSQTISEEQFNELEAKQQARAEAKGEAADEADEWGAKLRQLDPLFAAVAAVPWMPTDEDGGERRRLVQSRVLDELEAQGWDIRGAAHRMWRGEREMRVLSAGKDPGSQAAIQSLLYHVRQFDEKYGRRTLQDVGPQ